MIVFLNGRFVPEARAVVSVFDRSFLYGDGLFETVRVLDGKLFRWPQHLDRLERGARYLKISLPFSRHALSRFAQQLIRRNKSSNALLRLTLSRGVGKRGYSPTLANSPVLAMSVHPAPELGDGQICQWDLITASHRLPAGETLAMFKSCNKLPQVLARAEADAAGAHEALLLNTDGFVVEGSGSNLFWIHQGAVCTPPLGVGILEGVTRALVLEICDSLRIRRREMNLNPKALKSTQGVFLTLSSFGVVEVKSLDGRALACSPLTHTIRAGYQRLLLSETTSKRTTPSPRIR
jgi:aminodeoxychorismate lyase